MTKPFMTFTGTRWNSLNRVAHPSLGTPLSVQVFEWAEMQILTRSIKNRTGLIIALVLTMAVWAAFTVVVLWSVRP
jgi:hypothetical protein